MNLDLPTNGKKGFRRQRERALSRYQLTAVMDETAPAVIQHAHLIEAIQGKIREQDTAIETLQKAMMAPMRTRYRLHRSCGSSWWLSLWRAI